MDPDLILRGLQDRRPRTEVIGRDHPEFDAARRVWNGIADRRPAAIVRANDTDDVVATVRFAADHDILLAVRGGGHSLPGLSTCDDGIVLDLSAIREVSIDPERRLATVGGGACLGDLDLAGSRHGLATPAGVISHTGVGGLTLGGGMGWLGRRLGLTIDSLVGVEIVLADGRIVEVDAEHEPELFWGLRGGGGNFGVVTSFRFRMHPLGDVVIGSWEFPAGSARDVLHRYAELAADAPRAITSSFTMTSSVVSITAASSGSQPNALEAIDRYGRVGTPTAASLGEMTFLELQSKGDEHMRWGRRCYAKGGFLASMDDAAIGRIEEAAAQTPSPDAEIYVIQLGGAISDVDDGATAYTGRGAGHYWIVEPVWDDPADDAACLSWGREYAGRMAEQSLAGNYVNEQADADASVARSAYGGETYARLTALKTRVDPANVFRLNQNIAPATSPVG
jgi:FAD/FMN-containing dehydrogenase